MNPTFEIPQGKLHGKLETNYLGGTYYSFKSIPYAKPPLGHLRFKAPIPAEKWDGILDATNEATPCYQYDHLLAKQNIGSEDCLYLNIFTQAATSGSVEQQSTPLKPVMVFVHGGGFTTGFIRTDFYGPDHLLTADICLVTVQYRLGLLGFLSVDDPDMEIPGNAGLKDLVLALRWIQDNIKYFNGDPNNVTVFGESAGAAAVHYLVLSPQTKGLFHKAIMQSGCVLNPWAYGRKITLQCLQQASLTASTLKDAIEQLQRAPIDELYRIQMALSDTLEVNFQRYVVPVTESSVNNPNAFLTEHPMDIMKSGRYNHVPMIFGYTSREGFLVDLLKAYDMCPNMHKNLEVFVPHMLFGPLTVGSEKSISITKQIGEYYFGTAVLNQEIVKSDAFYRLAGDVMFSLGILTSVQTHLLHSKQPIYLYEMTLDTSLNFLKSLMKSTLNGACHGDDLGYLFKTPISVVVPNAKEVQLIKRFVELWTNFARNTQPTCTLDSTVGTLAKWLPCDKNSTYFNLMIIGDELQLKVKFQAEYLDFWNEIVTN